MDHATRETMQAGGTGTFSVSYRNVGGYHVFTSEDVDGLYVASRDPEKAYDSLVPALELLIGKNEGIDCRVEAAMSFREFVAAHKSAALEPGVAPPAVLHSKQFLLHRLS